MPTPAFLFPELDRVPSSGSLSDRRRTAAAIFTDLAQRPLAQDDRQSDVAPPAGARHRRKPRRDGWRAVESSIARLAGERFRGWRVRPEAAHGDDRVVEGVSDASRASSRRAAARVCVPRPGDQAPDGGAVRRRHRRDHRRLERVSAPYPTASGRAQFLQGRRPDAIHANGKRPRARWRARSAGRFATRYSRRATRPRRRFRRSNWSTANGWRTGCFGAPETCWGNCLLRRRLSSSRRSIRAADELGHRRQARTAPALFDVDVSGASRLWLIVQNANSTAVDKAEAVWARGEFVGSDGAITPLTVSDAARRIGTASRVRPRRSR